MKNIHSEIQGIKIICPVDCENSPKKKLLKELITTFALKDSSFLFEYISEDIHCDIVNKITIHGRKQIAEIIENKFTIRIVQIEILNIITHGKTAAVNGTIKLEDNSVYSFCNIFTFISPGKNTIKEITTYVIKMD